MKKILLITSSVKGKDSFSIRLSNAILEKLTAAYPGSSVYTRDLTVNPLPHLDETHLGAFFTPNELQTETQQKAIQDSNQAVQELMEADIVVIGVPLYNFGVPSTLKAWVDHIARAGVTFSYEDGFPKGLVVNKKVYLAIASGGVYSEGPRKGYDFSDPFLRAALGFLGIADVTTFRVEGIAMPELQDSAFPKALDTLDAFAF